MNQNQIDFTGSSILIVNNEPGNIDLLRQQLESEGYHISVAPSGEMPFKIAEGANIDLILIDVVMPGIDVFETCYRLKENDSTKDIPVILIKVKDETAEIIQGFRVEEVDDIHKRQRTEDEFNLPLNLQEVEAMVIKRALKETKGNVSQAARLLGINRTKLYRKMAQQNISIRRDK